MKKLLKYFKFTSKKKNYLNLISSKNTEIGTRRLEVYSSHIENIDKQR